MACARDGDGVAMAPLADTSARAARAGGAQHCALDNIGTAVQEHPSLVAELAARTAWPSLISAVVALAVTVAVQRA